MIGLALMLSACRFNPTIEEEIADKCGISVSEFQRIDNTLDKGKDGMAVREGRCRFTRTTKGVTEGIVDDGSQ